MKLTKQDKQQIVKEADQGANRRDLAKKYNISKASLYNILYTDRRSKQVNAPLAEKTLEEIPALEPFKSSHSLKEEIKQLQFMNDELKKLCADLMLVLNRNKISIRSLNF